MAGKFVRMVMKYMRVNGRIIKKMVKELIISIIVLSTLANG